MTGVCCRDCTEGYVKNPFQQKGRNSDFNYSETFSVLIVHCDIVIAAVDGQFTGKRFRRTGTKLRLVTENPKQPQIVIGEETNVEIWGVVSPICGGRIEHALGGSV